MSGHLTSAQRRYKRRILRHMAQAISLIAPTQADDLTDEQAEQVHRELFNELTRRAAGQWRRP